MSFYMDIVSATLVFGGATLALGVLKKYKWALITAVLLLAFVRGYYCVPTKGEVRNASSFGVTAKGVAVEKREFIFSNKAAVIRNIPTKVLGQRGAYVSGVLFGEKSNLDKDTVATFRYAGISHILAVSGLHVGIVMAFACFLLKKVKRAIRLSVLYPLLFAFVVLSGFSPSVLRAGLMMGIFLIADTFGYRYNLVNSLMVSGTVILFAVPFNLFNIGFLLSFGSTLGIGLFYPYIYARLKNRGEYIGGGVAMYLACQAVALPIAIYAFKELALLGLLGNLFTIPIVAFALICGMVGVVVYPLGISYLPLTLSATFMEMIEYIGETVGAVSFAVVKTGQVHILLIMAYYLLLSSLCIFAFKNKKPIFYAIGCMLFTVVAVSLIVP